MQVTEVDEKEADLSRHYSRLKWLKSCLKVLLTSHVRSLLSVVLLGSGVLERISLRTTAGRGVVNGSRHKVQGPEP